MLYPESVIDDVRNQNDIVDVISEYMPLKQKGSSYFGICPFHNEKTPSFSVDPNRQFYYCFGCGAGGNVYSFVMKIENCNFVDSLKKLAERAHISLPEPERSEQYKALSKLKDELYEIHKSAGRFYYDVLQSEEGAEAVEYLNKRRIHPAIRKKFGIGYSPKNRRSLKNHLVKNGFSIDAIIKSGLVSKNNTTGELLDRFFGRLIFPIFDIQGRAIAFGGRILKNGEPKYLNSPETPIFSKSLNLYGLNFAKAAKSRELIIVEGYIDMITVFQAGFKNVAASLGTSFNNGHAQSVKKAADSVVLLFDSDSAGENAALRAIPVLVKNGLRVRVAQVPDGKDPDEFIKLNGPEAFFEIIKNAKSYVSFKAECAKKNYDMSKPDEKALFASEAAKIISELDSAVERDIYIKEIALLAGISQEAVKSDVEEIKSSEDISFRQNAENKRLRLYEKNDAYNSESPKGVVEAQRSILFICSCNNKAYKAIKKFIKPSDFVDNYYIRAAEIIFDEASKGEKVEASKVIGGFDTPEGQSAAAAIFAKGAEYSDISELEKAVNEYAKIIKMAHLDSASRTQTSIEGVKKIIDERKNVESMNIII